MKRIFILFLFAALQLFAGQNLIKNPLMLEVNPKTGGPKGWNVNLKSGSGIDTKVTPEKGVNSLRIIGNNAHTTSVKIKGGHIYKCSYLLKTEGFEWMTAASFQILWFKGNKPMFKGKYWDMKIKNIQGGHNWTKVEIPNCEAPEGATSAEIRVLQVFKPAGTCWFAKFRMEEEVQGDKFKNRVAQIPRISGLTMDNAFDETNWKNAAVLNDFLIPHTGIKSKNPTEARIAFDSEAIWVYAKNTQKGIGDAAKKASTFDTQDAMEIFLLPPGQEYQYHILVPRVGKLFTCTEKWNDGNWPMKLHKWENHGVTSKVNKDKDHWYAVVRVPFKSMKVSAPKPGTEWRGNVCRSVYTGGREDSAWSFLGESHFQYNGDFGKFIFAEKAPVFKNINITNQGVSVEVDNPSDKPETFKLTFVRHNEKTSFVATEKTFTVGPGKNQVTELADKTELAAMRFVEIRNSKGELIRKHCGMPISEYLAFSVFDPENVRTQTLYLATDAPFYLAMNMQHSIAHPVKEGPHGLILRKALPFDLYLELPQQIKLTGFTFGDNWLRPGLVKPTVSKITRNGEKMNLWKFEMPFIVRWKDNAFIFFYECNAPVNKNLSGSYYFVQNGKEMPRHEMNFRTMKVGKLKKDFKRFLVDPGLLNVKTLTWWLPKNTARSFKRLGFNWVGITVAKAKNKTFYSGNNPKTDEDYYDLLIQDSKRPGGKLFYKTFITSSGPNSWKWTKTDPEPRAKDWFGKHPLNQYNYPALCPSYRGKYFQEWVQRLIESSAFAKYRITWLGLDLELWPPNVWKKICFCERCMKQFREYCIKHNKPEYASRKANTEVATGKDKEFVKFWQAFKQYQQSIMITDCAKQVEASVKGVPSTSPFDKFIVSDWTSPGKLDEGTLDLHEVPLYNNPYNNYLKIRRLMEKFNYRKDIICSTTFGQTAGCPDFHVTAEEIKDNIYESAAFGMQGIAFYYYPSMEPRRLKNIIDALNVIQPLEDLVIEGKISKTISSDKPEYPLTRLVKGEESLIGVRSYNADGNITMKIKLDGLKKAVSIYECETGKKIAQITPQNPEFSYTAKKHCCRLLYAGTDQQWEKRKK